ncbi:class I SAM-dependent methyltransferase [Nocardia cyriacigeorgica]|uniref:SAM-dependent methyltransferase n=1 Tax=Nocardia cyriacigeorgica TaxID=135487 RepID=UPI000CE9E8CF|nr:SAM-dependent methyltransferase [Nocardia cyriacigeorgica]MBF6085555.1 class I SAM-dependent methyltransferase [Nocardia cyriacigeorgica]MBF6091644.1 class I SAM-dependent methyltransferase [Nocardia cyriacigeorgica]MBF6321472.1 class I SAM-dependent methyltransferase [Nocardia cyriacigeorgica]MBF6394720.1 class I SAM-dependent methyltransferase [Nocardia cyriacigeorgica]
MNPIGTITRGTTGVNRLRRSDRWLINDDLVIARLHAATDPLVVDLGYGASPWTTFELAARLRTVRPDVRVVGLEIDPERVVPGRDGVSFARGGFELAGLRPVLVRAFNVLRQYPESAVPDAWSTILSGLAPGGLLVDGTCDELGRRSAWVLLDHTGPLSLTLAWDPFTVDRPSDIAERLPKALIHRNVPGEGVHALLTAADRAWSHAAPLAPFGPRVRWRAAANLLREQGFPVRDYRRRMRDNVLSVPWDVVAPLRLDEPMAVARM